MERKPSDEVFYKLMSNLGGLPQELRNAIAPSGPGIGSEDDVKTMFTQLDAACHWPHEKDGTVSTKTMGILNGSSTPWAYARTRERSGWDAQENGGLSVYLFCVPTPSGMFKSLSVLPVLS